MPVLFYHCVIHGLGFLICEIKLRILIRRRFTETKSLHVMYYGPFDGFMGL